MKTFKQFITEEDDAFSGLDQLADYMSDNENRRVYLTHTVHGPEISYMDSGLTPVQYSRDGEIKLPVNAVPKIFGLWAAPVDESNDTRYFFTDKKLADLWMEYKNLTGTALWKEYKKFRELSTMPQIKAIRGVVYDEA